MQALNSRHARRLAAALLLSLAGPSVQAATATANFNVTATVLAGCSVAAINDLAFGNYDNTVGNTLTSTTANVTCSLATPYSMIISLGNSSTGSNVRRMTDGASPAHFLAYNVYTDAARTTIWPSSGTTVTGTGLGVAVPTVIYGSVPAGQAANVSPGSYSDVLVFTVNY